MTAPHRGIDDQVAAEIKRLHRKHPRLGHHGLQEALQQEGIHVDADELERYLKASRIKAQRPRRPLRWTGLPSWLGGPASVENSGAQRRDGGEHG